MNKKKNKKQKDNLPAVPMPQRIYKERLKDKKKEKELKQNSKTKYKVKSKKFMQYLIPNILGMSCVIIIIVLLLFKVSMFWIVLLGIIFFPIVLISFGINTFLLMRDKKEIGKFITKKITKNYIVAKFFGDNRTITEEIRVPLSDGKSFEYDKGVYIMDEDAVFFNHKKEPVLFYVKGLPNPLKFNFSKYIQEFIKKLDEMSKDPKAENRFPVDWEGKIIDVSYSSENLQLYKNDKIFKEIHQDLTNKYMKLMIGFMVLLGIAFMVIIIMAVIK